MSSVRPTASVRSMARAARRAALVGRAEHAAERDPLARLELVMVADDVDGGGGGVAAAEQEDDLLGGRAHALELAAVEETQILGMGAAMSLPVGHWALHYSSAAVLRIAHVTRRRLWLARDTTVSSRR